ncbi:MBL fold metallo-hydrolase [Criblamydia sequanensis]|uniref:Rhodanese domain-containing protein n=1 Tax=Candidatus Criblamydia sequanensis CRIB-18 TaxID=1437425 RepID=A0A090D2R0_9BACT|nr:MBL fold metallo-hydrolase [Criblamydia sequanensis]CDR34583.1 Conserved hypothetical protein [Criblamydia sequanensis CRIB-18]
MLIWKQAIPGIALNSYLIGDESQKTCVVIDPSLDFQPLVEKAKEWNFEIKKILETHIHADFISGASSLKSALNGKAEIYSSGENENSNNYADVFVKDGDQFSIGSLRFKALFTPGHTPEHLSWLLFDEKKSKEFPQILFSGDFLFPGSLGRPDLLGDEAIGDLSRQLYESSFVKLQDLPDNLFIYPAHGAGSSCAKSIKGNETTLGEERKNNPYLKKKPFQEWFNYLLMDMPKPPQYFFRVKKINAEKNPYNLKPAQIVHLSPKEAYQQIAKKNALVLDVRNKEAFSKKHVKNSLFIGKNSPQFLTYAGLLIEANQPLILLAENEKDAEDAFKKLQLIGIDQILGAVEGGISSWEEEGLPINHLELLDPASLKPKLEDESTTVLDVRSLPEWNQKHIEKAKFFPITEFSKDQTLEEKPYITVCQSGYRAAIIASLLLQQGHKNISSLQGGMDALNL